MTKHKTSPTSVVPNPPSTDITPDLASIIHQAVQDWMNKHGSPEAIRQQVFKTFEKDVRDAIYKLMGFETRWSSPGHWEVDHCNGRAGNSVIGSYLEKHSKHSLQEWIDHIGFPKPSEKEKSRLRAAIRKEYLEHLKRHIQTRAKNQAEMDAEQLISELSPIINLEHYLKTLQLLTNTQE